MCYTYYNWDINDLLYEKSAINMSRCKFLKNRADYLRSACLFSGEAYLFIFLNWYSTH